MINAMERPPRLFDEGIMIVIPAVNNKQRISGNLLPTLSEIDPIGTIVIAVAIPPSVRTSPIAVESKPRLFAA